MGGLVRHSRRNSFGTFNAQYFHQDHLGSTRVLTDSGGAVVATQTFDAYGALAAKTGVATTNIGFAGQYRDSESGLIYLRARYYDPSTAQFLSRGPIEHITGQPYLYANNNPVNNIDPTGLNWVSDWGSDVGATLWSGTKIVASNVVRGAQAVGEAAQDTGEFIVRNRGVIATIGAAGTCLIPAVGLVGCGDPQQRPRSASARSSESRKKVSPSCWERTLLTVDLRT